MAQIPLPLGTYKTADGRASSRRLVNCFSEVASTTSQADARESSVLNPPSVLRRADGVTSFASVANTQGVRGMWEMAGVIYVVIGQSLYTLGGGTLTQVATGLPNGNSFCRMTDNGFCLVILFPLVGGNQLNTLWSYTKTNGLQQLMPNSFQTYGAIDCWFVDTFIVFLGVNGEAIYTDDGQVASGTGPITFLTGSLIAQRELATDPYTGLAVDHREILAFGRRTSDGYLNVGAAVGSPLSQAPNSYMAIGMHPSGAYTAVVQDQSVFFLASDCTIRRRSGQTPTKVSDPGIDEILAEANQNSQLIGCYALAVGMSGHLLYVLTIPGAQRTLAYDCTTQEWFELESFINGFWQNWRPSCAINNNGTWYVGDSASGTVGYLNPLDLTDLGTPLKCSWTTQNIYSNHDRIAHRRLELVTTAGGSTSQLLNPQITLRISDDGGYTYRPQQPRNLGFVGSFTNRVVWYNLGASRDRVYYFELSDPTPAWSVDIQTDIQPGKY